MTTLGSIALSSASIGSAAAWVLGSGADSVPSALSRLRSGTVAMLAFARSTGLDAAAAGAAISVLLSCSGSSLRRRNQMPPAAAASINSMATTIRMLLKGLSFSAGSVVAVADSLIFAEALPPVRGAGCCV